MCFRGLGLAASAVSVGALLVGCFGSAFTESSSQVDVPDGGPAEAGAPFCKSGVTKAALCADFDEDAGPSFGFGGQLVSPGASLSASADDAVSAPRALLAELPTTRVSDAPPQAVLVKDFTASRAATHASFYMQVASRVVAPRAAVAAVSLKTKAGAAAYTFALGVEGNNLLTFDGTTPSGLTEVKLLDKWVHVEIDSTFGSAPKFKVAVDEVTVIEVRWSPPADATILTFSLGATSTAAQPPLKVRFDNVVLTGL